MYIVLAGDESRLREPMKAHHYLGAAPVRGETLRDTLHYAADREAPCRIPVFTWVHYGTGTTIDLPTPSRSMIWLGWQPSWTWP